MSEGKETKTEQRSSYMQDYYRNNKERILNQRKRRYQSDPLFRERLNESRRSSNKQKKEPEIIQSATLNTEDDHLMLNTCKMRVIHPEDNTLSAVVTMFTLSDTALMLGVEKVNIDQWLYGKKLPLPRYRNKSNWRLYTEDEVNILKRYFILHRRKCRNNNYTFRLTRDLQNKVEAAFGNLIGGLSADKYEEYKA